MTDTSGNEHARWADHMRAYGADMIQVSEQWIAAVLTVIAGRAADPASFTSATQSMDPEVTARRILGVLLEHGWTPPAPNGADHA